MAVGGRTTKELRGVTVVLFRPSLFPAAALVIDITIDVSCVAPCSQIPSDPRSPTCDHHHDSRRLADAMFCCIIMIMTMFLQPARTAQRIYGQRRSVLMMAVMVVMVKALKQAMRADQTAV